jgi:lipid-binding SYLF domain-containing protein
MRYAIFLALFAAASVGCGSTAPDSKSDAEKLDDECIAAKKSLMSHDSSIGKWFDTAYGYVLFPSVGKGAIGIGGAHGKGQVYEAKKLVGYSSMTQATIGLALGGQAFTEVIFFKDQDAFRAFKEGTYELTAQASAVAVKDGAGATSAYSGGVKTFVLVKGGAMADAAVGGQKFKYAAK